MHISNIQDTAQLIYRIKQSRNVRYWFSASGYLCGVWQGRNGKTYAVSRDRQNRAVMYRTSPRDWS